MRFLRILFWGGIIVVSGIAFLVFSSDVNVDVDDEDIRIEFSEEEVDYDNLVDWSSLGGFDEVTLSGAYKVTLHEAAESRVEVEGPEEQVARIKADLEGEHLIIKQRKGFHLKGKQVHIHLYVPTLESIKVSGGVDMKSEDPLEAESLEISVSGAGNVNMDIEAEDLEVGVSGAGKFNLSGKATEVEYSISGAGDIRAFDLVAERVEVSISGAGNAEVHAKAELDATISGAGKVTYDGNPEVAKRKVYGAGTISKR